MSAEQPDRTEQCVDTMARSSSHQTPVAIEREYHEPEGPVRRVGGRLWR